MSEKYLFSIVTLFRKVPNNVCIAIFFIVRASDIISPDSWESRNLETVGLKR